MRYSGQGYVLGGLAWGLIPLPNFRGQSQLYLFPNISLCVGEHILEPAAFTQRGRRSGDTEACRLGHNHCASRAQLSFIALAEEHYDFALVTGRKQRPAVQAFLAALESVECRKALELAGFRPA